MKGEDNVAVLSQGSWNEGELASEKVVEPQAEQAL